MKTKLTILGALVAATAVLASPRDAHALGPIDLEVGAKAGVGTNPSNGSLNPLGFGLGARGGIAFLGGIYAGVNFMYYLGGSDNGAHAHAVQYGLEAGYGFKLAIITIRPQLGIGNFVYATSIDTPSVSNSTSNLYLEPGAVVLISLGTLYVGADANILIIPGASTTDATGVTTSNTDTAFTLHGQIGFTF